MTNLRLPGLCPQTGEECFYTKWHQASRLGKGLMNASQVESFANTTFDLGVIQCNDIRIDDQEPFETGCAIGLALGMHATAKLEREGVTVFGNSELAAMMTRISGVEVPEI